MFDVDSSGTPNDPHGYEKLRSAVESFAGELDRLGLAPAANRLRGALRHVGSPSEWMGEIAFALKDVLATDHLPLGLRHDMEEAVEAVRGGFRHGGDQPSF